MICRPKGGRSQPRYHNIKNTAEEKYFRAIENRKEIPSLTQNEIYIMVLNNIANIIELKIDKIRKRK